MAIVIYVVVIMDVIPI